MGIHFHKFVTLFFIIAGIIIQCSNRDRSNPFDPGVNISPPIDLFIQPTNNLAHLSWQVNNVTGYQGFRLYRAVDNDTFELFKELSPDMKSFIDSTLSYYHWYQYQILKVECATTSVGTFSVGGDSPVPKVHIRI